MAIGNTVQHARITATLDGMSLGVFEQRGEAEVTAPDGKYRLGGMGPEIPMGGKSTNGNIELTRIMDTLADSQKKKIKGRVGKGTVVVTEQPLNEDEVAEGEPDVWTGRLVGYTQVARAADGDDANTYTITVSVTTAA